MTWSVEWSPRSSRDLLHLPHWRDAHRIARAVYRFAVTGEGELERVPRRMLRLRAAGCCAVLTLRAETLTLVVWTVYRAR